MHVLRYAVRKWTFIVGLTAIFLDCHYDACEFSILSRPKEFHEGDSLETHENFLYVHCIFSLYSSICGGKCMI